MSKTGWVAILSTVAVVVIILAVSNTDANINSKTTPTPTVKVTQDNSDDHHGGGEVGINANIFNSLINKPAPDFTLEDYSGDKISLGNLKGKNVILFFNEGLMCYPACWNQIAAFGKDEELSKKAIVLNITVDPKNDWKQAVDKMPEMTKATVLFDSDRQISAKYGVLTLPSSMHKGQFPGHSYVVIDEGGIVKFVQDDVQMAVRNKELAVEIDKL